MKKIFIFSALLIFISCSNKNKTSKNDTNDKLENQTANDEVWKQFLRVPMSTMEKMPPDSNCFIILNHKKVSYYKKNQLVFSDDLFEYMKNDSLILYRINNQPLIQIGYNRKDSIVLLTTGHPEGVINPTGEMEYFAKKVQSQPVAPFH